MFVLSSTAEAVLHAPGVEETGVSISRHLPHLHLVDDNADLIRFEENMASPFAGIWGSVPCQRDAPLVGRGFHR